MLLRQMEPDELVELGQLRYKIYVHEMNRPQAYADHQSQTIIDPLDATAVNLVALVEDRMVGTQRVNSLSDGRIPSYEEFYEIETHPDHVQRSSICTRFMVLPEYRGTSIPLKLAVASYAEGLKRGCRFNYIDCNDHLVGFFERLGYVEKFVKHHDEYGHVHCMVLAIEDRDHLVRCRSPFRSVFDRYQQRRSQSINHSFESV